MRTVSHRKILSLMVVFAAVSTMTGCFTSADASDRYVSAGLVTHFIDSSGAVYTPEGGRFRADLLDTAMFTPGIGPLMASKVSPMSENRARRVVADETFGIKGVSEDEWIIGRSNEPGSDPPYCRSDHPAYFFTAIDSGSDLDTGQSEPLLKADTLASAPVVNGQAEKSGFIELTSAGLISVGWPAINWRQQVSYRGQNYQFSAIHHTGFGAIDVVFPWAASGESESIAIRRYVEVEPHPDLAQLFTNSITTDYVKLYRSHNGAALFIDPCPNEFRQDEYVFYRNVKYTEPEGTPVTSN